MATITLKTADGSTETFECDADTTILDAAEEAGIDAPYSCRAGACSTCAGKVISGTLNNDEQSYLDDEQLEAGFSLLCIATPESDCVIDTEQEEKLF